ncbi:hypothetical protein MMC12_002767 [Toensbergia leucococca]|nr:hypothetical protein [Toensbergia leucococca]
MTTPSRPYLSNGQVLQSPPFSARVRSFLNGTYTFVGLYVTTLFSLDAYAAGEVSPFNVRNQSSGGGTRVNRGSWGRGGGGGGSGSGGPGSGGGGKKVGRVDDIRGPECKSCG